MPTAEKENRLSTDDCRIAGQETARGDGDSLEAHVHLSIRRIVLRSSALRATSVNGLPARVRLLAELAACLGLLLASGTLAAGPWRAAEPNSYGWQFMTPEERIEHQRRMRSFETYDECKAYQAEHHAHMAERARQAGVELTPKAQSGCDQLRARGRLR